MKVKFRQWKKGIFGAVGFIVALSFTLPGLGQSSPPSYLPNIVPPPPDAAELGKYGQIPVDKSTGIPSISIPLYEIKTPRFTLPISLSYHALGIKVDESASWVGLGWVLNAGGVITRTIVDLPDNGSLTTLPLASSIQFPRDSLFLDNVLNRRVDAEPDNFFYNFSTQSGAFIFGQDGKPLLTPYKPLKITYNGASFQAVDESGNIYMFNDVESVNTGIVNNSGVSSWYLSQMISADLSDTIQFVYNPDPTYIVEASNNFSQTVGGDFVDVAPDGSGGNCSGADRLSDIISTISVRNETTIHLSSIVFKNGRLDFKSKSGRLDNGLVALDSVFVSNLDYKSGTYVRIKSFKISTDYFISTANNYTGFANGDVLKHRLRLTGVSEIDNTNIAIKNYTFDYNSTALPPINNFAQDKWGFYNGQVGNPTLLQSQQVINSLGVVFNISATNGYTDRGVYPQFIQAGMLQTIHYPTQGSTSFIYEPNQYINSYNKTVNQQASGVGIYQETQTTTFTPPANFNAYFHVQIRHTGDLTGVVGVPYVKFTDLTTSAVIYQASANATTDVNVTQSVTLTPGHQYQLYGEAKGNSLATAVINVFYTNTAFDTITAYGPGLRINSIKNYDASGSIVNTQTYKYGTNESGQGMVLSGSFAFLPNLIQKQYFHGIWPGIFGLNCTRCTFYKTVYSSNSSYPLSTFSGSPIAYPTVTTYEGDPTNNAGKTVSDFDIFPDIVISTPSGYSGDPMPIPYSWKNGTEIREAIYKNDGTNNYILVHDKVNSYTDFPRTFGRGLKVGWLTEYSGGNGNCAPQYLATDYFYFDYSITSGNRMPVKSVSTTFDQITGLKLQDNTKYYYDNLAHMYPTRIVTFNSTGDSIQKQMNYPQDMVNAAKDPTGIYQNMSTKNIISPVIETIETQNGRRQLSKVRSNFSLTSTSNPAVQGIEIQNGTYPSEVRYNYNSYDNYNNIQNVSKSGDLKTSYLWGYNHALPVAKIVNADNTLFTFYIQATKSGTLTVPVNFNTNAFASIVSYYTGNVTLSLSFINGAPSTNAVGSISYTLSGTHSYSGNICICNGPISLCSGNSSNVTIPNVAPGTYTLNIITVNNSNTTPGVSVVLNYGYPGRQSSSSGIREFYYQGFEDDSTSTSAYSYAGDRSHSGSYSVPYTTPNSKNYFVDYQYYNGNKWVYNKKAYVNNMILSDGPYIDEVRVYPDGTQMSTYTYKPLYGVTSETDFNGKTNFYEYDGLQRLKNIKDYLGNIIKNFQYNYSALLFCGTNCMIFPMQTFAGTNTISYPVGVFNIKGKLLGNVTNQAQYISTWMADTLDSHTGTIVAGADSMHFKFTLNSGRAFPNAVTGCRYYQYDLPYTQIDAIRNYNAVYVDYGDQSGMFLGKTNGDTSVIAAPNTIKTIYYGFFDGLPNVYWTHNYPNASSKTITLYHNDGTESTALDNAFGPATSLTLLRNLHGNLPQNTTELVASDYQQASALTVASITNWNTINSITAWQIRTGDLTNPCLHLSYAQDFMANNRNLQIILTDDRGPYLEGYEDTTFKISRLKSNWNTYFTNLTTLEIIDDHWNREDLSALIHLNVVGIGAGNLHHSYNQTNNPLVPLPVSVIDNIINQLSVGAGQHVSNGLLVIPSGGTNRSSASDDGFNILKAKGWTITINGSNL